MQGKIIFDGENETDHSRSRGVKHGRYQAWTLGRSDINDILASQQVRSSSIAYHNPMSNVKTSWRVFFVRFTISGVSIPYPLFISPPPPTILTVLQIPSRRDHSCNFIVNVQSIVLLGLVKYAITEVLEFNQKNATQTLMRASGFQQLSQRMCCCREFCRRA